MPPRWAPCFAASNTRCCPHALPASPAAATWRPSLATICSNTRGNAALELLWPACMPCPCKQLVLLPHAVAVHYPEPLSACRWWITMFHLFTWFLVGVYMIMNVLHKSRYVKICRKTRFFSPSWRFVFYPSRLQDRAGGHPGRCRRASHGHRCMGACLRPRRCRTHAHAPACLLPLLSPSPC